MENRKQILAALRQVQLPDVQLPEQDEGGEGRDGRPASAFEAIVYDDPLDMFEQMVGAVGGQVISVDDIDRLSQQLDQLKEYRESTERWSLIEGVESQGSDWAEIEDPHDLARLECFLAPGRFGVAENGAVWVSGDDVRLRAALFVTQHLVLTVKRDQIVHHMHDAYGRLSFDNLSFGTFISGPSKTADIEQSLVIGAQGARSLTVVLCPGT